VKVERLFASDDPERVFAAGVLLKETLQPGRSRIFYDHVNGSDGVLVLALVLLNDMPTPAMFRFRGGHGGPGADFLAVGHLATAAFLQETEDRTAPLGAGSRKALIARTFMPGENLCAVFEIECASELRVMVVAMPTGVPPEDAVGELRPAPSDGHARSGVFALGQAESPETVEFGLRAELGANPPESLDGRPLVGGYAVVRTLDFEIPPDDASGPLSLTFEPRGGPATGTLIVQGVSHEIARTAPGKPVCVVKIPADTPSPLRVVTAAELNSYYPVLIALSRTTEDIQPAAKVVTQAGTPSANGLTAVANASDRMIRPRSRIMEPLASRLRQEPDSLIAHPFDVILELNTASARSRADIQNSVNALFAAARFNAAPSVDVSHTYLAAQLTKNQIAALLKADEDRLARSLTPGEQQAELIIARVWTDHAIHPMLTDSLPLVKGDAAHASFGALGDGIVWAVLDSGIERHKHFEKYANLELPNGLHHRDFTGPSPLDVASADLTDPFGHGTHVAGIIAGQWSADALPLASRATYPDPTIGVIVPDVSPMSSAPCGMAPKAKLMSMRVIDQNGTGKASAVIAALDEIFRINGYGGAKRIHGVNLSVGYEFFPSYEACGRTPVCEAVNRLVDCGVIVVVAAGNSGDVLAAAMQSSARPVGLMASINDPGNADRAITVASCYNREPFTDGIAPSSSKGPTLDGRPKPDVTAPGEHVVSCATATTKAAHGGADYIEMSGTSMAAPHVSGALAAFLSARREFIGRPGEVKSRVVRHATDLSRDRAFQGAGLINLFSMLAD